MIRRGRTRNSGTVSRSTSAACGGLGWFRVHGLVAVVAALCVFCPRLGVAGHQRADRGRRPYTDTTVLTAENQVTVRWTARSTDHGLRFRLYRGAYAEAFELVSEKVGVPGTTSYRVDDEISHRGPIRYELRAVMSDGTETLLASVMCLVPACRSAPGNARSHTTDHVVLVQTPVIHGPRVVAMIGDADSRFTEFRPEPIRPPPRPKTYLGPSI